VSANHNEGEKIMNMEKTHDKNASSKTIIYVINTKFNKILIS
jgi:hypothetical protein